MSMIMVINFHFLNRSSRPLIQIGDQSSTAGIENNYYLMYRLLHNVVAVEIISLEVGS